MPKTRKHPSSRNKTISLGSPSKRRTLKCDFNIDKILQGRKLGEGGFGAAYVYDRAINDAKSTARYLILNKKKQYVVKVVTPNEQGVVERKYIDRAKNEAAILRKLKNFYAQSNQLTTRPDDFFDITELETLCLGDEEGGNKISILSPNTMRDTSRCKTTFSPKRPSPASISRPKTPPSSLD